MSHRRQVLNFQVYLTDPVQVAALQAQYPNGRVMSPDAAATEYAAPIQLDTAAFSAPCTRSTWFQSSFNYPRNVATFSRNVAGWWALIVSGLGRFFWAAQFVYGTPGANVAGVTTLTDHVTTAQRKFAIGFELASDGAGALIGEGSTPPNPPMFSRSASRLPGGYGVMIRGANGRQTMPVNRNGASNTRMSWTRLYFARRSNAQGYLCSMTNASGRGIFLQLLDGVLVIHDGASGTPAIVGTVADMAPNLDEWVRLDVLLRWGTFVSSFPLTGDEVGRVIILKNGELKSDLTLTANNNGITVESGANCVHTQSDLGFGGTNDGNFAVDVDDWICSEFPGTNGAPYNSARNVSIGDHVSYAVGTELRWYKAIAAQTPAAFAPTDATKWTQVAAGPDFANGSHVTRVSPKALSGSDTGWAGDFRLLQQLPALNVATQGRTSSTSGAICQVTTDFPERVLNRGGFIGVASFTVATWAARGGAVDGTVGYKLGAAAPVNATIAQVGGPLYGRLMYRPAGAASLAAITGLEILHTKAADASAATCYALHAAVEMIGNFAAADIPPGSTVTGAVKSRLGTHVSAIPISQWAQALSAPTSPVLIKSGSYVGNGTGQDLTFAVPPTFLFIRASASDAGGVWWYPSMMAAHAANEEGTSASRLPEVRENIDFAGAVALDDDEQQYFVRLAGSNNQINANGVTYQYVAVCDPGARFMLAQAGGFDSAFTTGFDVRLQNPDFTPEAVLCWAENLGNAAGGNVKRFKGPGNTTNQISENANSAIATGLAMSLGKVTMFPSLNSTGRQHALVAFRSNDGSGDAGARRVVELQTWTGNGSGSRDILIPGSTGRRPLFIAVWATDAGGMHFRDPSHTGVNSSRYDGANITNAITAGGLDQFTVGAALNTNTVVYNALIIVGGTTAGSAGWSAVATEEAPVAPDSLDEGDYDELTDEEIIDAGYDPVTGEPIAEDSGGVGDPGELTTDIAASCVSASTRLVNVALSRIGVGKTISNLGTDTSQEAVNARTVYKQELDATLRDFPWPFATGYATLVLEGGTSVEDPVNGDWTFSYRAPTDSIFVRRIVDPTQKRAASRTPIAFKMSADDDGDLVFCDEPGDQLPDGDDVTVEYTRRPDCPASRGDAIFRSAAAWRLARALCEPLGRDAKKAEMCERQYLRELLRARAVHLQEQEQQSLESDNEAEWIQGRE